MYTTILKNRMKTTLEAIIGGKQSAAIKKQRYYTRIPSLEMLFMFDII